jgi:hypothetical protein
MCALEKIGMAPIKKPFGGAIPAKMARQNGGRGAI